MLYFSGGLKTIVQVLGDFQSLSKLKEALEGVELIDALRGKGPFTVFAPSNAAFEKVKDLIPADAANLKKLLLRHVVKGERITHEQLPQFPRQKVLTTMNDNEKVKVWKFRGKGKVLFKYVDASYYAEDAMEVDNGVIHMISDVLIMDGEFPTLEFMEPQVSQGKYIYSKTMIRFLYLKDYIIQTH